MEQGHVNLYRVEVLVLDEADQMLDMGFIVPLRRIVAAVPRSRQTVMFSATMPAEIRRLANEWLSDPAYVQVGPIAKPAELVEQSVYFVEPRHKPHLLTHFLQNTAFTRTLVFARTKRGADKIVKQLIRDGIRAAAIHGNKSQNVRQRTLNAFKSNRPSILVATDVAARGRDIEGVSHVVNYDLPDVPEMYVHRIGRTARAGASGIATSFCAREERGQLRQIERLTCQTLTVEQNPPEYPRERSLADAPLGNGNRAGDSTMSRGARQDENLTPRSRRGRRVNAGRRYSARERRYAYSAAP
jgi:ATP-dependent RNA helicase RhlE